MTQKTKETRFKNWCLNGCPPSQLDDGMRKVQERIRRSALSKIIDRAQEGDVAALNWMLQRRMLEWPNKEHD